ncbi:LAFE_0F10286g1_1 [Lachancea fermentati]|uniref:LAFE_0F10286g1_1 n=1 Tax=Lachancea fermentati TaxID=4955 RepID=A0A1G4MFH1_LACFM|nr:LAFE_0F10286g1_1 [Lachancea fermentati]
MVKIAIITYSLYGHIDTLARAIQKGIEAEGGKADLFRVEETLSDEILAKMHAPSKPEDVPVATTQTLEEYDAFLFGIPTRYGSLPAQWSAFWDSTGGLWTKGALYGKPAGVFVSTGTYGGGQEVTIKSSLSYLVHHGLIFIPLGYKNTFAEMSNVEEVHGGSAWGAGTLAGPDGSRTASALELRIAETQGKTFYKTVKHFPLGKSEKESAKAAQSSQKTAAARQTQPAASEKQENKSKLTDCCVVM